MPRAVSSIVSDATITVGAENTNVRAITIQLKNGWGKNINFPAEVELVVLLDAAGADYVVTGGSTGIAIGASGKLQQIIAKKRFVARSTAAGLIALTWTDTGTEAAYLGVILPNGKQVISSALTNA
ncbi:MAG TPA: hypothetical protein VMF90_12365 [Rhizobiaceae bacterium]|nr:hypothetical protein [Rhizobiaceae bacterium]